MNISKKAFLSLMTNSAWGIAGIIVALSVLTITYWSASTAWSQSHDHKIITPADLKWQEVPSLPKGAMVAVIEGPMDKAVPFTARIKVPGNFNVPPHSHPGIERATVISGTFNMGFGDKFDKTKTTALEAGSIMIMQPKVNHFAWSGDKETVVQIHGTGPWDIIYVNPEDDPRKK